MFVRCSIEPNEENPRYFAMGQILAIDSFAEKVDVVFYDVTGVTEYYPLPGRAEYSWNYVTHVSVAKNAKVMYAGDLCVVKASVLNKDDGFYYYYLQTPASKILFVCETEIQASFVDATVLPLAQLKTYEFQNPIWFFGRSIVSKTMQTVNNSLYGFKDLAGCKISLKPYQLKTVMRCLQEKQCRNMIADEVGLGKTIEAIAVLKVYLKDKNNQRVLILVPSALIEQWKTELAFKFKLFEGENSGGNVIFIKSTNDIQELSGEYDFIIADEVHRILNDSVTYNLLLNLSQKAKNILMLSATPIQKRQEEYQKLLTLIQPDKYGVMDKEQFDSLLELQGVIIRKVHDALESLDSYLEEIKVNNNEHTEETEEAFDDTLDCLEEIQKRIKSEVFGKMISNISYDDNDFGISSIQTALAYVCENYQLEKSIIRNRRSVLKNDIQNERVVEDISYELQTNHNNIEYQIYKVLSDFVESFSVTDVSLCRNLISAYFSSARAFDYVVGTARDKNIPLELASLASQWKKHEESCVDNINAYLDDPAEYESRIVNVVDYIDQNTDVKKILVFANHPETFKLYQRIFEKIFGDTCCYFSSEMNTEERELSVYRFQNEKKCRVLLSDESGGEGRNFQYAEVIIHVDLPWSANTLEQRIGRLDRIGRPQDLKVVSVVPYARSTVEEDLFTIWENGLHIFTKSQSGLEIIMNEIDEKIQTAVCSDFKYGLRTIIPDMVSTITELEQVVKRESYFDLAAYQYQTLNQMLERSVSLFSQNETQYFGDSMMGWASLSGFNASHQEGEVVRFCTSSFSVNSAANSMFIPPNMKQVIDNKLNQMRNRIRMLNNDRKKELDTNYIQGTFNRALALKNDYIHFFAPGDEIFDSIIGNAVGSYKGTCAAIMLPGDFNWTGFIMTFKVVLDEAKLYSAGLQPHEIDKYRGFLPAEQYMKAIPIVETRHTEEEVVRIVNSIMSAPKSAQKNIQHLGSRHASKGIVYAKVFKDSYPKENWERIVSASYKKALEIAKERIKTRFSVQLSQLKGELLSEVSAQKAISIFYGREDISESIRVKNDMIYKIMSTPKIALDSVCYMRMNKNE